MCLTQRLIFPSKKSRRKLSATRHLLRLTVRSITHGRVTDAEYLGGTVRTLTQILAFPDQKQQSHQHHSDWAIEIWALGYELVNLRNASKDASSEITHCGAILALAVGLFLRQPSERRLAVAESVCDKGHKCWLHGLATAHLDSSPANPLLSIAPAFAGVRYRLSQQRTYAPLYYSIWVWNIYTLSIPRNLWRTTATLAIAGIGLFAGVGVWRHYMLTPWTRDGRVLANSVPIAAEVSGRIIDVRVRENESVKKGDILFVIDQSSYKSALQSAEAIVESDQARMEMQESNAARAHKLTKLSISAEQLEDLNLQAKAGAANYRQAAALRETAQINLDRTIVSAPVNGYVTNLVLDVGDYADVGKPVLAIVDSDSFRVEAYLEETKLNLVRIGDEAEITLMSGAPPLKGRVDSIARGIGDTQNPTGANLLQNVNATFEWVRLAQRIPVRITLPHVPAETVLSFGMTATVSIMPRRQSR